MNLDQLKKGLILLIALLGYYLAISLNISGTSIFLEALGPQYMPYFLRGYMTFFMFFSIINAALSYKVSATRQFSFLIGMIALLFLVGQIVGINTFPGILITYFCGLFAYNVMSLQLYNLISSLLTPLQSKNFLPLVTAACNIAVVVGSFGFGYFQQLGKQVGVGYLGAILLSILCLLIFSQELLSRRKNGQLQKIDEHPNIIHDLKETADYIFKKSTLFKVSAVCMILVFGLRLLTEYKFNVTMAANLSGDELGKVLGYIAGAESVLLIVTNSFLLKKSIYKFGVIKNFIFYPIAYLATLTAVVVAGFSYISVIGLEFVHTLFIQSVVLVAIEQLLQLLPKDKSRSGYLLMRGLLFGFTNIIFSSLMLVYTVHLEWEKYLNTFCLFLLAGTLLIFLFKLRRLYFEELRNNLLKNDSFLKLRSIDLLAEQNNREKGENFLRKVLSMGNADYATKTRVLYSLGIIGNYQTLADLIGILRNDDPKVKFAAIQAINEIVKNNQLNKYPVSKHLLLKTYEELLLNNTPRYIKLEIIRALKYFELSEVIYFLEKNLASNDAQFIQNVVETLGTFYDKGILLYIKPLLTSDDVHVVCAAIVALWQFKDLRLGLLPKITSILMGKEEESIAASLYLIGAIGAGWEKEYAEEKLEHHSTAIRHRAMIALIKLGDTQQVKNFIKAIVNESEGDNFEEMEFLLSSLRKMPAELEKKIIKEIQQMSQEKVDRIKTSMENSKYVFSQELAELS